MWANNVRATTRGQRPGRILMANRWVVFCSADDYGSRVPPGCHFLALVRDYGDHQRVRLFDRRLKQIPAAFYRLGRRGLPIG